MARTKADRAGKPINHSEPTWCHWALQNEHKNGARLKHCRQQRRTIDREAAINEEVQIGSGAVERGAVVRSPVRNLQRTDRMWINVRVVRSSINCKPKNKKPTVPAEEVLIVVVPAACVHVSYTTSMIPALKIAKNKIALFTSIIVS